MSPALVLHRVYAAPIGGEEEADCPGIRLQRHSARRQGRSQRRNLSVILGVHLAGKSVAGLTTYAAPAFVQLHRNGKRKRLDALALQARRYHLDHGFVLERRVGIWSSVRGFRWINANFAMNPIH